MNNTANDINLDGYSIPELNQLMENAKRQIQKRREAEIQQIREQMQKMAQDLGMKPEDILNISSEARKRKVNRALGKVKYRNPDNQEQTWTGRGKRPNWLVQAIEKGKTLDDFKASE